MNRKMTRLAFGAKCGGLGASGLSACGLAATGRADSPASASAPNPQADRRNHSRRLIGYNTARLLRLVLRFAPAPTGQAARRMSAGAKRKTKAINPHTETPPTRTA